MYIFHSKVLTNGLGLFKELWLSWLSMLNMESDAFNGRVLQTTFLPDRNVPSVPFEISSHWQWEQFC